ncbi:MAG: sugar ABC transporter permease [Bacilli bacterium]|nr:sugar ABC transporter permease [Bacilli bacterium]
MKMTHKRRDMLVGLSFIAIWIVGFAALTLYPLIKTFIFSFQDVDITVEGIVTTNIKFENYRALFKFDLNFMDLIRMFVEEIFIYVPIIIVFAMMIAVILNQKIRFKGVFRSIFFLPVIIVSGPVVAELFSQGATTLPLIEQYGILDIVTNTFPESISEPLEKMFSEIIFILWMSGVQILIFLAGLQKIDSSIYEAAAIDGASPWEMFWKITLPSLGNLISINILYSVVTLSSFATNDVLRKIRIDMFSPDEGYGYASAEAVIYLIVILLILGLFGVIYLILRKRSVRMS